MIHSGSMGQVIDQINKSGEALTMLSVKQGTLTQELMDVQSKQQQFAKSSTEKLVKQTKTLGICMAVVGAVGAITSATTSFLMCRSGVGMGTRSPIKDTMLHIVVPGAQAVAQTAQGAVTVEKGESQKEVTLSSGALDLFNKSTKDGASAMKSLLTSVAASKSKERKALQDTYKASKYQG
ncbi:MAG: hypothetical protein S4CHLAM37_11760 [Chlamydiia bacterium]|nr:hypothetical protein [Chlamydiia bacterium]